MRPFTETLPFNEALRIVMDAVRPISRTERLPLIDADGRVAARDVVAVQDVPPFDRAAMDGYAVIAGDTAGAGPHEPRLLRRIGRVFTGQMPDRAVSRGECIEIATGAPMPAGADAVVMVEDTAGDGDAVQVRAALRLGQNIGRRGADIRAGHTVIASGQVLTPSRIGAMAATGAEAVEVFAKPTVAVVSNGNEIVEPGRPLRPGEIYDINSYTLRAVAGRHGGVAVVQRPAADTIDDLLTALDEAARADIVVLSGGSSVGDRDLIRDAMAARGEIRFHGIAVKPGKPTLFGHIGDAAVFGMPGYPTSCLSNAYMLLVPFLRATARLPAWVPKTIDLPLARRVVSTADRHQFYTVRIADGRAEPAFKASGDITSMANADGYFEIEAGTDSVEAGTVVTVKLF